MIRPDHQDYATARREQRRWFLQLGPDNGLVRLFLKRFPEHADDLSAAQLVEFVKALSDEELDEAIDCSEESENASG